MPRSKGAHPPAACAEGGTGPCAARALIVHSCLCPRCTGSLRQSKQQCGCSRMLHPGPGAGQGGGCCKAAALPGQCPPGQAAQGLHRPTSRLDPLGGRQPLRRVPHMTQYGRGSPAGPSLVWGRVALSHPHVQAALGYLSPRCIIPLCEQAIMSKQSKLSCSVLTIVDDCTGMVLATCYLYDGIRHKGVYNLRGLWTAPVSVA